MTQIQRSSLEPPPGPHRHLYILPRFWCCAATQQYIYIMFVTTLLPCTTMQIRLKIYIDPFPHVCHLHRCGSSHTVQPRLLSTRKLQRCNDHWFALCLSTKQDRSQGSVGHKDWCRRLISTCYHVLVSSACFSSCFFWGGGVCRFFCMLCRQQWRFCSRIVLEAAATWKELVPLCKMEFFVFNLTWRRQLGVLGWTVPRPGRRPTRCPELGARGQFVALAKDVTIKEEMFQVSSLCSLKLRFKHFNISCLF